MMEQRNKSYPSVSHYIVQDTCIIFQEEIKEDWRHHLYKLNAVENSNFSFSAHDSKDKTINRRWLNNY